MIKIFIVTVIISILTTISIVIFKNHRKSDNEVQLSLSEIFEVNDNNDFVNEIGYYYATKNFKELNEFEKIVSAIWSFEAEINNGGFDQFFFNSAGDEALFTVYALNEIGSIKVKNMLLKANSFFPENKPSPYRDKRWKQMERWDDEIKTQLEDLDSEFYEYNEDYIKLLYVFCKNNKENFKEY